MKADLQLLKEIQSLDREIYASEEWFRQLPEAVQEIDRAISGERQALSKAEEELKESQLLQKRSESELQDKEAGIRKYEIQLDQVKTNKEYSALQNEIRSMKADASLLEEKIIELLDRVEASQQKVKEEKLRMQEIEKQGAEKKAALEGEEKERRSALEQLVEKKKSLIKNVTPEVASLYERIVKNKKGLALVLIDGETCSACQMRLRPQQLNEIKRREQVVLCEQCQRILYSEE